MRVNEQRFLQTFVSPVPEPEIDPDKGIILYSKTVSLIFDKIALYNKECKEAKGLNPENSWKRTRAKRAKTKEKARATLVELINRTELGARRLLELMQITQHCKMDDEVRDTLNDCLLLKKETLVIKILLELEVEFQKMLEEIFLRVLPEIALSISFSIPLDREGPLVAARFSEFLEEELTPFLEDTHAHHLKYPILIDGVREATIKGIAERSLNAASQISNLPSDKVQKAENVVKAFCDSAVDKVVEMGGAEELPQLILEDTPDDLADAIHTVRMASEYIPQEEDMVMIREKTEQSLLNAFSREPTLQLYRTSIRPALREAIAQLDISKNNVGLLCTQFLSTEESVPVDNEQGAVLDNVS